MPAKSKAQQMAAGIAHAAKKGEIPKSELRGASKQMFKSMSGTEVKKFAKTKRKGLPKKKTDESGPVTARQLFLEGRDDAPKLGLGKTGLKFARMTSKEAFKTDGGTDAKWKTSAKLRTELAGEKPGTQMKSMDKVGKVPRAMKGLGERLTPQQVVDKLLV
jgi:hypothetical protein